MSWEGVLTSKGQLVIPSELRRNLRLTRGTRVRFEPIEGGIGLYPQYGDEIDRFCGILKGLGLPPDIEHEPEHDIE